MIRESGDGNLDIRVSVNQIDQRNRPRLRQSFVGLAELGGVRRKAKSVHSVRSVHSVKAVHRVHCVKKRLNNSTR